MSEVVLLTGGTGTFGHAFVSYTLANPNLTDVIIRIFSRDEYKQQKMRERFRGHEGRLTFALGDVRDKDRVARAAWKADIIIHAAALKQVPTLEANPFEAVKTNIYGSQNVLEAAIDERARACVLVSSDKSPNPENVYGATKMLAERLWLSADAYAGGRGIKFAVARYGNVWGSRGSVIETWRRQEQLTGKIQITAPNMTRFVITPMQAARFVWRVVDETIEEHESALFVPILPSARLRTIALAVAPRASWEIIGTRPGERMDETLLTAAELARAEMKEDMYVVRKALDGGVFKGEGYTSRKNDRWLDAKELRQMLVEVEATNA